MVSAYVDFSEANVLTGFTSRWATACFGSSSIVTRADDPSAWQLLQGTGHARALFSYDLANDDVDRAITEVAALIVQPTIVTDFSYGNVRAWASGAATSTTNAYYLELHTNIDGANTHGARLSKYVAGAFSILGGVALGSSLVPNTPYHIKLRVEDVPASGKIARKVNIGMKLWTGTEADEPASFSTFTDSSSLPAIGGWAGPGLFGNTDRFFYTFRVATGGGSAPTAPVTATVQGLSPAGIATLEALGSLSTQTLAKILGSAIPSGEVWSAPSIASGSVAIVPPGTPSQEAVVTPQVGAGPVSATPSGIASLELVPPVGVSVPAALITPAGVGSQESVSVSVVNVGAATLLPTGIISQEIVNIPNVGVVQLIVAGIPSQEFMGTPSVGTPPVTMIPTAIGSQEALGSLQTSVGPVTLQPSSILSEAIVGALSLGAGSVGLIPASILTREAVVSPSVDIPADLTSSLSPSGIPTQEVTGTPSTNVGSVVIVPLSIETQESLGLTTVGKINQATLLIIGADRVRFS